MHPSMRIPLAQAQCGMAAGEYSLLLASLSKAGDVVEGKFGNGLSAEKQLHTFTSTYAEGIQHPISTLGFPQSEFAKPWRMKQSHVILSHPPPPPPQAEC